MSLDPDKLSTKHVWMISALIAFLGAGMFLVMPRPSSEQVETITLNPFKDGCRLLEGQVLPEKSAQFFTAHPDRTAGRASADDVVKDKNGCIVEMKIRHRPKAPTLGESAPREKTIEAAALKGERTKSSPFATFPPR